MKKFTVHQASVTFKIEADEAEYHSGGAFLLKSGSLVFAGPSAYTTLIDDDAIKEINNAKAQP